MTSGSPVVFVVEDDSAVRDSLRRLVTSVGFMARNSAGISCGRCRLGLLPTWSALPRGSESLRRECPTRPK